MANEPVQGRVSLASSAERHMGEREAETPQAQAVHIFALFLFPQTQLLLDAQVRQVTETWVLISVRLQGHQILELGGISSVNLFKTLCVSPGPF